eukprot:1921922-Karenia_brevis.AAC.1
MEDHRVQGEYGPYVDRAQEEYVDNTDIGNATHDLNKQYSKWSSQATVMLASKGGNSLADITKKLGYGERVLFRLQKTKAPDELEMYHHQGIAWVVSAQAIIRLLKRSKDCTPCHQVFEHQADILQRAEALGDTYCSEKA